MFKRTGHTARLRLIGFLAVALVIASASSVQAQTATATPTPTPTLTTTPTPTVTAKVAPQGVQRHRERENSPAARADTAAPRFVTLFAESGLVTTTTAVALLDASNDYTIRGVKLYAKTVTTSGSATLKIDGVTVLTAEPFVAGQPSTVTLNRVVKAGSRVQLDVASNGLTGAVVFLDTIP